MTKFNFIHQHASNLLSRYYGIPAVLIKTQYTCFYKISHSAKMLTENSSACGRGRGEIMGRPLQTCDSATRALTEITTVLIVSKASTVQSPLACAPRNLSVSAFRPWSPASSSPHGDGSSRGFIANREQSHWNSKSDLGSDLAGSLAPPLPLPLSLASLQHAHDFFKHKERRNVHSCLPRVTKYCGKSNGSWSN